MKNRIALAAATLTLAFGMTSALPAHAEDQEATPSCDTVLCLPTECRQALVELSQAQRHLDRAERRIERKNATIKRLRAQLAAAQS